MKLPLLLVILCQVCLLNAQPIADFMPARYVDTIPVGLYQLINSRYQQELNNIQASARTKMHVKDSYKDLFNAAIKNFNDDHMMVKSEITEYLGSIVERVAQANDFSSKDVNAFAYRSEVPNAACHGYGVLSVMLGLLARLDTDDQVAFVVCHELAHHLARDNLRDIDRAIEIIYAKDTREDIRKAQRSTYYSYSKTSYIFGELDFNLVRHSRAHEFSADSTGLLLYLKAGYDPASALQLLQILGKVDDDTYAPLDIQKFLVSNGITPEPLWLQYTPPARWHYNQAKPDSLKTHPNTTERTIAASRLLSNLGYTFESLNAAKDLRTNPYKTRALYEMVDAEFHFRNYSRALYNSIQLSAIYPNDPWFKAMTGRCLYEIYTRQKNHTLRTSVDQPGPSFSDSYNRLLTFILKLRLVELEYITYQYMTSQPEAAYTNEHFIYSLWLTSGLKISKMDQAKVRDDYMSLFPSGMYSHLMKK